jgi:Dolichyl-phosphate-mannose-protein mannosyltransferase
VLVGLVARLVFVTTTRFPVALDAVAYRLLARNLADGRGYVRPLYGHPLKLVATAAHPPLFSSVLAVFDTIGLQSLTEQRVALAIVGSLAVLIMGLLGREVSGPAVGIGAALISALDPLWLGPIGALMSESIYLIIIPLVMLLALWCLERPTFWRFGALGLAIALGVLTRSEAIDFVVLLGVPLLLMIRVSWKSRFVLGVALLVGVTLLLGPWLVRNEVKMGGAVLSTQEGGTLLGSYCSSAFDRANGAYGSFSAGCAIGFAAILRADVKPPDRAQGWTELSLDRATTESAKRYALSHLGDLPRVVLAREESAWGLGNQNFQLQLAEAEGRNRTSELVGKALYWVLVPFVIVGAVVLARRSPRRFVVVVVPIAVAVLTVALTYGSTRLRVVAEPSLAVLAALGVVRAVQWLSSHVLHATTGPRHAAASASMTIQAG